MKTPTVFILTRTSGRPRFFAELRRSIRSLEYPDIVHVVHTDDPRDSYVEGDIIIRGENELGVAGNGTFNLYNNRLLQAVPHPGWIHFIDDDDAYVDPQCFNKLLARATDRRQLLVGRVERWAIKGRGPNAPRVVFPRGWGHQRSFQTECFMVHTSCSMLGRWPVNKGGDHTYTRSLTQYLPIVWVDGVIIARAQEGKGHGRRQDARGHQRCADLPPEQPVCCKAIINHRLVRRIMTYGEACKVPGATFTYDKIVVEYPRAELRPPTPPILETGPGLSVINPANLLWGTNMAMVRLFNKGKRGWKFSETSDGRECGPGHFVVLPEAVARKYAHDYPRDFNIIPPESPAAKTAKKEEVRREDLDSREKALDKREAALGRRESALGKREANLKSLEAELKAELERAKTPAPDAAEGAGA